MTLSGKEDTAQLYLQTFFKKYPDSSIDNYIIENLDMSSKANVKNKDNQNSLLDIVEELKQSLTTKQKNKKKYKFSVQIGAYRPYFGLGSAFNKPWPSRTAYLNPDSAINSSKPS